jgi:hypothetical protein
MKYECCVTPYLANRIPTPVNIRFSRLDNPGARPTPRREAIAEFYFSSEAYDTFGPEHDNYKLLTPVQMPDSGDWEIVDAIRSEELGAGDCTSEFPMEAVERVRKMIMISDEQFDKYVAEGVIKPEDVESEKAARAADTEEIFEAANRVSIQFSTGKRREIDFYDCNLFECYEQFEDSGSGTEDWPVMIRLPLEGYHRTVFLNAGTLDYVSLPTHKIEEGRIETHDGEL